MKTVSDKVVRHSLANYPCRNDWWGTYPSAWKFGVHWTTRFQNDDFFYLFSPV